MSRSVDLFIDAAASLEEVATAVAGVVGATVSGAGPPRSRPDGSPVGDDGRPEAFLVETPEVHAVLRAHRFLDDGVMVLTRYRYALSVVVPDGGRPQDSPAAAFLRVVARELAGSVGWPMLLVIDLQYTEALSRVPGPGGSGPVDRPSDPGAERTPDRFDPAADPDGDPDGDPAADADGGPAAGPGPDGDATVDR